MKQILHNGNPVTILKVLGTNDGYYWDYTIWFEYLGEQFCIINAGRGSGYIPNTYSIKRGPFERLFGNDEEFYDDINEYRVEYLINYLLDKLGDAEEYEEFEED